MYKAADVDEIFDAISYSKGSTVIRMLQSWLGGADGPLLLSLSLSHISVARTGKEPFRKGLVAYLAKFKYSNAVTQDLWDALSASSGKDVASVMNGVSRKKQICDSF